MSFRCKLCSNGLKNDGDLYIINDTLKDMLETLFLKKDVELYKKSVICSSCHRKAEENYQFKNRCIFTENDIIPFVTDNMKINLNEIRSNIIQSESIHKDKNVCRLCLEFVDNEMTLSEMEKDEFKLFFPEINLNLTSAVILCLTCYDRLQKYFIFVKSYRDLENQIKLGYSRQSPMNSEENNKNAVYFKELYSYPVDNKREQNNCIKLEFSHQSLMNTEEDEQNPSLQKEFGAKYEINSVKEKYPYRQKCGSVANPTSERENKIQIEHEDLEEPQCDTQHKRKKVLKQHIRYKHPPDYAKTKMIKCKLCDYKSRDRSNLNRHNRARHSDPSKVQMHQCEECDYKSKLRENLKLHILRRHSDPSKIQMYNCGLCEYKTKFKDDLKYHNRSKHTDPSKITMYECETCDYKSKFLASLRRHAISKHTDPSELVTYTCKDCDYETKHKADLKYHIRYKHTDPSKIKMYKCTECDYATRFKVNVKNHKLYQHTDPSNLKMYKCQVCDYESKDLSNLKKHNLSKHTDPSKIKMYKCEICDYQSKFSTTLKRHIISKHINSSEIYT